MPNSTPTHLYSFKQPETVVALVGQELARVGRLGTSFWSVEGETAHPPARRTFLSPLQKDMILTALETSAPTGGCHFTPTRAAETKTANSEDVSEYWRGGVEFGTLYVAGGNVKWGSCLGDSPAASKD